MLNSNANRNRIAIFDLLWFVPVAVLATLDCYDRLPAVTGTPVPTSALAVMILGIGALAVLRPLRQRYPCSAAEISVMALWILLLLNASVILVSLLASVWLLRL